MLPHLRRCRLHIIWLAITAWIPMTCIHVQMQLRRMVRLVAGCSAADSYQLVCRRSFL